MAGVRKFTQPDHVSRTADQSGFEAHCADLEAALGALAQWMGQWAPRATAVPDMTVTVGGGTLSSGALHALSNDKTPCVAVAEQTSWALIAPTGAPRIDRIGIDLFSGGLWIGTGAEAENPVPPAYPGNVFPVCQVALAVGQTAITNYHLTDERVAGLMTVFGPSGGDATAYGSSVDYQIWSTSGTYSAPKPVGARLARILLVGGGGGGGGCWVNAGGTLYHFGGSGGGAAAAVVDVAAEDFTVVVGDSGAQGAYCTPPGTDNATAGGAGGATTVTGVASGLALSVNGGGGGARGTAAAAGAAGSGGAATLGGWAGQGGQAGYSGGTYTARFGGNAGEQGQLGLATTGTIGAGGLSEYIGAGHGAPGLVMIEWLA